MRKYVCVQKNSSKNLKLRNSELFYTPFVFIIMQKFVFLGDSKELASDFKKYFKEDRQNPEFVVCARGHGTLLKAEKKYPSVPKLFLHHIALDKNIVKTIYEKLASGDFELVEHPKLFATVNRKKFYALNEVNLHNIEPHAIRIQVFVNDKPSLTDKNGEPKTIVGNGALVSTPLGSTGYFSSVINQTFSSGFGIAINQPTAESDVKPHEKAIFVPFNSIINLHVVRGPGFLYHDSEEKPIKVKTGDKITLKRGESTYLIKFK